jgi:hypothetical protein
VSLKLGGFVLLENPKRLKKAIFTLARFTGEMKNSKIKLNKRERIR